MLHERSFIYPVSENELNTSTAIGEYLRIRGYSRRLLSCLKRAENSILLNGVPARTNRILKAGDLLRISLAEEASVFPPFRSAGQGEPFRVVFEDDDILIADKASSLPVHPSAVNTDNTLASAVCDYYAEKNRPIVYRCVNRLDRDTTGLTIIALHMLSACVLSAQIKEHKIRRTYLGIVKGYISREGTVCAPIARQPGSSMLRCVSFEHGENAVTHFEPLSYRPDLDLSLIRLNLETGRTHQIRVHMRYLGHPLIGDHLYYPDLRYINRQALHSASLEFLHPVTDLPVCFHAPLPGDMQSLFPSFHFT